MIIDRRRRDDEDDEDDDEIERTLRRCGFASRLVTLDDGALKRRPMIAEIYEGGGWNICLILGWRPPSSSSSEDDENVNNVRPPLLEILPMNDDGSFDGERRVIDIGQVTTLWDDYFDDVASSFSSSSSSSSSSSTLDGLMRKVERNFERAKESLRNDVFPLEKTMQTIYNGRVASRARPPASNDNRHRNNAPLTKKDIPRIASRCSSSNVDRVEELLRNLLKMGDDRTSRMVDSSTVVDYLYPDYLPRGGDNDNADDERIARRMVAARVIAEDAGSGGRFTRRSCQLVSARYHRRHRGTEGREGGVRRVTLVNGGWIAVDPSVKTAAEGRKFAASTVAAATSSSTHPVVGGGGDGSSGGGDRRRRHLGIVTTAADERIARRLECLAMGDVWRGGGGGGGSSDNDRDGGEVDDGNKLELDVRAALTGMGLPLTPRGASLALIRIGIWSESRNGDGKVGNDGDSVTGPYCEPWSPEVLDAARTLAQFEGKRRELLAEECRASKGRKRTFASRADAPSDDDNGLEGRVDLSSLPCVCIDAERATFRDDSIGIRPRSSTGRRVNKAASKWEVLIHIADCSDLYFDDGDVNDYSNVVPSLRLLRKAAERRGQSRYDLPFGMSIPVAVCRGRVYRFANNIHSLFVTLTRSRTSASVAPGGIDRAVVGYE